MRLISSALVGLGLIGAATIAAPTPSSAQGVYFEGPGFGFSVGRPYYRERYYYRYYDSDRPYYREYRYERPYGYYRYRWRDHDWD
jgi:hypothetical protein